MDPSHRIPVLAKSCGSVTLCGTDGGGIGQAVDDGVVLVLFRVDDALANAVVWRTKQTTRKAPVPIHIGTRFAIDLEQWNANYATCQRGIPTLLCNCSVGDATLDRDSLRRMEIL